MPRPLAIALFAMLVAAAGCGPAPIKPGLDPSACDNLPAHPASRLVVTVEDVRGEKRAGVEVRVSRHVASSSSTRDLSCLQTYRGADEVKAVTSAEGVATLKNVKRGSVLVEADGATTDFWLGDGETKQLTLTTGSPSPSPR